MTNPGRELTITHLRGERIQIYEKLLQHVLYQLNVSKVCSLCEKKYTLVEKAQIYYLSPKFLIEISSLCNVF